MESWFLFPVGVLIGTLAMSSGISGSNFWIPVYLLGLHLDPRTAFWMALLTMLFGFGSGAIRNLQAGTVDRRVVRQAFLLAGPAAALGALASTRLPFSWMLLGFAGFASLYGAIILTNAVRNDAPELPADPALTGRSLTQGRIVASLAGLLQGLIATGAGTLFTPSLLKDRRIANPATAVGTSVVLVFGCSLVAAAFRLDASLLAGLRESGAEIATLVAFAGPGAALGGQLGPRLAQRLPRRWLRVYLGVSLVLVGGLVAVRALA